MNFGEVVFAVFLGDFLFCIVLGLLNDTKEYKGEGMKKTCGNCVYYLTDEDDKGNVTEFRHDRNKESGFCAMRELFYTVKKDEKACPLYTYDRED